MDIPSSDISDSGSDDTGPYIGTYFPENVNLTGFKISGNVSAGYDKKVADFNTLGTVGCIVCFFRWSVVSVFQPPQQPRLRDSLSILIKITHLSVCVALAVGETIMASYLPTFLISIISLIAFENRNLYNRNCLFCIFIFIVCSLVKRPQVLRKTLLT